MTNEISNSDDTIDVRDVIARFEELESELQDLTDALNEAREALVSPDPEEDAAGAVHAALGAQDGWHEDNGEEYTALQSLLSSLKGYGGNAQWRGDWYPITLIRHSYFKQYAMELAEDIGAINNDAAWPNDCIDWDKAARQLSMDYSSVEFEGVTYWYR